MKLKDKIKQWLFKDELETLRYLQNRVDDAKCDYIKARIMLEQANDSYNDAIKLTEEIKELVTPLLDVGTDIGMYDDHSWAVVCVKGKPEYVKFIPLDHKDTREVIDFLKRYRRSNHVVDSPLAFKDMIRRERILD